MATYTERAEALATALIDAAPTPEQIQRIGNAFAEAPVLFGSENIVAVVYEARPDIDSGEVDELGNPIMVKDTSPLTGAEKAEIFVRTTRAWAQHVLRTVAENKQRQIIESNITLAGDTAAGDL